MITESAMCRQQTYSLPCSCACGAALDETLTLLPDDVLRLILRHSAVLRVAQPPPITARNVVCLRITAMH
jgi:hypothetical protein